MSKSIPILKELLLYSQQVVILIPHICTSQFTSEHHNCPCPSEIGRKDYCHFPKVELGNRTYEVIFRSHHKGQDPEYSGG